VMARGHKIDQLNEVPLVVSDGAEALTKTSAAVSLLKKFGAYDDVEKVISSKTMRAGKGKMRGRRFVQRRGPLVIFGGDGTSIKRAFRNIPGVELADVSALNLLQLAPGGHMGRFCVWTQSAFEKLDAIFGTATEPSTTRVHNGTAYRLPKLQMGNSDLSRLINSDEVQSKINAPKEGTPAGVLKRNPMKNSAAMEALNPAAAAAKKRAAAAQKAAEEKKAKLVAEKRSRAYKPSKAQREMKTTFYKSMIALD